MDTQTSLTERLTSFLERSQYPELRALLGQAKGGREAGRLRIAFVGQYSAGKSSIISALTGQKLKVGAGITTNKVGRYQWGQVEIIDTPGIENGIYEEHDETTYNAIAQADLIVFVVTYLGFTSHIAKLFDKILRDKGRAHELMLVVNKMDATSGGNTPEQQRIIFEHNIRPNLHGHSESEFHTAYLDLMSYTFAINGELPSPELREQALKESGFPEFEQKLKRFIAERGGASQATTGLQQGMRLLEQALTYLGSDDQARKSTTEATVHLLQDKLRVIQDAIHDVRDQVKSEIQSSASQILGLSTGIIDSLTSSTSGEEVEAAMNRASEQSGVIAKELFDKVSSILGNTISNIQNENKAIDNRPLTQQLQQSLTQVHTTQPVRFNASSAGGGSQTALQVTNLLSSSIGKFTGTASMTSFAALMKTSSFSGSSAHNTIYSVGKSLGFKFKPWGAVKYAKFLGYAGVAVGVIGIGIQLYSLINGQEEEKKKERELNEARQALRKPFEKRAQDVELTYNKELDLWIEDSLEPAEKELKAEIASLRESESNRQREYSEADRLLRDYQALIHRMQTGK